MKTPRSLIATLGCLLLAVVSHPLQAQQYSWSTFAGTPRLTGSTDTRGLFNQPYQMARDSNGNVYVADYNNATIRKITASGVVSTLAGTAGQTGSVNGTGAAISSLISRLSTTPDAGRLSLPAPATLTP